jgi:hypothetical protein
MISGQIALAVLFKSSTCCNTNKTSTTAEKNRTRFKMCVCLCGSSDFGLGIMHSTEHYKKRGVHCSVNSVCPSEDFKEPARRVATCNMQLSYKVQPDTAKQDPTYIQIRYENEVTSGWSEDVAMPIISVPHRVRPGRTPLCSIHSAKSASTKSCRCLRPSVYPRPLWRGGLACNAHARHLPRKGLIKDAEEKDACGVGFVGELSKEPSRKCVTDALGMLVRMSHRGACGCEENTGTELSLKFVLERGFCGQSADVAAFSTVNAHFLCVQS